MASSISIQTSAVLQITGNEFWFSSTLPNSISARPLIKNLKSLKFRKSSIRASEKLILSVSKNQSSEFEALQDMYVHSVETGESLLLTSLWDPSNKSPAIVVFLTHFGDLSSWEYAQKICEKVIPAIERRKDKIPLVVIGLGSVQNATKFSEILAFPSNILFADPDGKCYKALEFSPGFGANYNVSPYLKLLPMLLGIGSPGTIQEVLRGYSGDRQSKPVFSRPTPFDILGTGYQRPFELATLRLLNMLRILPMWSDLCPPKTELLTQQGGTVMFKGTEVVFKHKDSGILRYTDIYKLLSAIHDFTS